MHFVATRFEVEQPVLFERAWPLPECVAGPDRPRLAWMAVTAETPLTIAAARELVDVALANDSSLMPETRKVRGTEIGRFWRHLGHHGVRLIEDVVPEIVDEFVQGAARSGTRWAAPAGPTQRNRRAAVRYVFQVLRGLGFPVGDPTLDLGVVEDRARRARPVTDAIVQRLQAAAPHELVASRRAVVLALAQAGATNTEITAVAGRDVDLEAGTVSLPGGTRIDPRVNRLTNWGWQVLRDILTDDPDRSGLLVPASEASAAATVSNTMSDLCQIAAIRPRVTVESIRAWRARRLFAHSKSIEEVARFLGTRSLDVAADIVDHRWRVGV